MSVPRTVSRLSATLVASVVWSLPLPVEAQVPAATSVFPPAPRSLRQNLTRARKAIDEQRFSDAVAELGVVLTDSVPNENAGITNENQDFFVEVSGQPGEMTSIKTEALALLGALPPKGRELYEVQFGADARALLNDAVQFSDLTRLNDVVRRYFHTKAGYEAAVLLGRLHWDAGQPVAAALSLERVAKVAGAAVPFEPELSVLLAASWSRAKQPDRARRVLESLISKSPKALVRLGNDDFPLPAADQSLSWLAKHFETPTARRSEEAAWTLFRGNSSRNATSAGGLPLKRFRWQARLTADEDDRQLVEALRQQSTEQGHPLLPVSQPLAVGNVVLLRSAEMLLAIDVESGKRIWNYPWDDLDAEAEASSNVLLAPAASQRDTRMETLRERLFLDAPFGQISSDGQAVYLLETKQRLANSRLSQMMRQPGRRGMMPFDLSVMRQNQLISLDLRREGYMQWIVGGDTGGEDARLAGAYFLGPPLPLFGQLYLIAEVKGELRLVVLDAQSGRQVWTQQLSHSETYLGWEEPTRRLAGASPSFADGVLVCPTSAGAIVAIDAATRSLLWGYQYASPQDFPRNQFGGFPGPEFNSNNGSPSRWLDATVTIADGCVLATPADANELICLDLLTGKPRWKPRPRADDLADMLFVGGVQEGKAILVGKRRITAIRLADGMPAWPAAIELAVERGELVSGRGYLTEQAYFLPTTKSELLKLNLQSGQIEERVPTDHVLGNLICSGEQLLSVAGDRAALFHQVEPLRRRVAAALVKNPDDAWALALQGELHVHDGKRAEALSSLLRAVELNARDEGTRSLLVDAFLGALQSDFAKHRGLAARIEPLIENDSRRADYLLFVALGCERTGDAANAAKAYVDLARFTLTDIPKAADRQIISQVQPSPEWSVRIDRLLTARLRDLHRGADPAARELVQKLATDLAGQSAAGGMQAMRQFVRVLGFHPAADEQRLELGKRLIDANQFLEAEQTLAPLQNHANPRLRGTALALATQLYELGRQPQLLPALYERLRSESGDVPLLDGKTSQQLFDIAALRGLTTTARDPEFPEGLVTATESKVSNQRLFRQQFSVPISTHIGDALQGHILSLDTSEATTLRDGRGTTVLQLPMNDGDPRRGAEPGRAAARGHLLMASLGGKVVTLNLFRARRVEHESIIWQTQLLPVGENRNETEVRPHQEPIPFEPLREPRQRYIDGERRPIAEVGSLSSNGVCFQKVRTLTCIDPSTGGTIWTRNDLEQGCELFGDDESVLAIVPPNSKSSATMATPAATEALLFDLADGRLLGNRKLPPRASHWTTYGRNVLAWEKKDESHRLFLFDAVDEKEVWSETFTADARGMIVNQNAVAVLQPDGRFQVRSLADGTVVLDHQLKPVDKLTAIHVLATADQWLLIANDDQPLGAELERANLFANRPLPLVNGWIWAFDARTRQPMWPVPAEVRGFGLVVNQPAELPTLWLLRRGKADATPISSQQLSRTTVLCLDRRTGESLLRMQGQPALDYGFEISSDSRKHEISLHLPQSKFTLQFSNAPRPPAPAAQIGTDEKHSLFERMSDGMRKTIQQLLPVVP